MTQLSLDPVIAFPEVLHYFLGAGPFGPSNRGKINTIFEGLLFEQTLDQPFDLLAFLEGLGLEDVDVVQSGFQTVVKDSVGLLEGGVARRENEVDFVDELFELGFVVLENALVGVEEVEDLVLALVWSLGKLII